MPLGRNAPSKLVIFTGSRMLQNNLPVNMIPLLPPALLHLTWFPSPTRGMYCSGGESWRSFCCKYD